MEAVRTSERRSTPARLQSAVSQKALIFIFARCENLKSHILYMLYTKQSIPVAAPSRV
jgi:hypothetical protein